MRLTNSINICICVLIVTLSFCNVVSAQTCGGFYCAGECQAELQKDLGYDSVPNGICLVSGCYITFMYSNSYSNYYGLFTNFAPYPNGEPLSFCNELFPTQTPTPPPAPTPSPTPSTGVDLSVSGVSFSQPVGTIVPTDKEGNLVIETITPPTASPAPKVPAKQVEATVTVNMSGSVSGATQTDIQLILGGQVIADQNIDISNFVQGSNAVKVDFMPPTDPSLLGVLPLTVIVNASQSVQETNYQNDNLENSNLKLDTIVLCQISDTPRNVPFYSQLDPKWANEIYGIPQNNLQFKADNFGTWGCAVTNLDMLFSSYGITNTPIGSPADPLLTGFGSITPGLFPPGLNGEALTPGSLNFAMANYKHNFDMSRESVGFDARNVVLWKGAAEIARAGYRAQCRPPASCDPSKADQVVSFYNSSALDGADDEKAIDSIENQICGGNPIILKFSEKKSTRKHFMLATGIVFDRNAHIRTLQVNNPGRSRKELGENVFYSTMEDKYPSILESYLFKTSSDPSMIFIESPIGVQFVVMDPLGRRTGYDPTTGIAYSEIPGASYTDESVDTPNEDGFIPDTLVDQRYFMSGMIAPSGAYEVKVFSVAGGTYYLDYQSYDESGTSNDVHYKTGVLNAGSSETVIFQHVTTPAPVPNTTLTVSKYFVKKSDKGDFRDADLILSGNLAPLTDSKLSLTSNFEVSIGGITGYQFQLPASVFKRMSNEVQTIYNHETPDVKVHLDSSGNFMLHLKHVDLSAIDADEMGVLNVSVDAVVGGTFSKMGCQGSYCSDNGSLEQGRMYDAHNKDKGHE